MPKTSIKPRATIIWNEQTAKLRRKFATLTDKDLYFDEGKLEEMLLRLQKKAAKSKHELYEITKTLM